MSERLFEYKYLFHKLIAGGGKRFIELRLISLYFIRIACGELHCGTNTLCVAGEAFIGDQIVKSDVPRAFVKGHKQWAYRRAESFAQAVVGVFEIGVFVIHLVYKERLGLAGGIIPCELRADLAAALCIDNDDRACGDRDRLLDFACEIEHTRSVKYIYLFPVPFHIYERGLDGIASFDLFRIEIACGISVGRLAESVDSFCEIKHRFDKRCLAVAAVADKAYIPDLRRSEFCHEKILRLKLVHFLLSHYYIGQRTNNQV